MFKDFFRRIVGAGNEEQNLLAMSEQTRKLIDENLSPLCLLVEKKFSEQDLKELQKIIQESVSNLREDIEILSKDRDSWDLNFCYNLLNKPRIIKFDLLLRLEDRIKNLASSSSPQKIEGILKDIDLTKEEMASRLKDLELINSPLGLKLALQINLAKQFADQLLMIKGNREMRVHLAVFGENTNLGLFPIIQEFKSITQHHLFSLEKGISASSLRIFEKGISIFFDLEFKLIAERITNMQEQGLSGGVYFYTKLQESFAILKNNLQQAVAKLCDEAEQKPQAR